MVAALLIGLLLALPPIRVAISPHVGHAPLQVTVTVTIARDERNREVCVVLNSDGPDYRSSCWTLDGERATVSRQWSWWGLSAGSYEGWAILGRSDGSTVRSNVERLEVH